MMKRFSWKLAMLALCAVLLCGAFVGCTSDETKAPATNASTPTNPDGTPSAKPGLPSTSPRPTLPSAVPTTDDTLIGTWNVQSDKTEMTGITFAKEGNVTMTYPNTVIGGIFTVENNKLTITATSKTVVGTFTVDGNTVTFVTENSGTMIFTKAA